AYIEWYQNISPIPDKIQGMYSIRKVHSSTNSPSCSIVSVSDIRQSCMLFPQFGASKSWPLDK
ncbi:hypothetical protein CPB83DRAFT_778693, partial [Crepidotus variabilis]